MSTRPGVPYEGLELDYYDECVRTIPAIAKMHAQGRMSDKKGLIDGLMATGAEFKVEPLRRWSILCTAYMTYAQELFGQAALHHQESLVEHLDRVIAAATRWAVRRG